MQFTGKLHITITIIVSLLCSIFLINHYISEQDVHFIEIVVTLLLIGITWSVGVQFRNIKIQKLELLKFAYAMDSSFEGIAIINKEGIFEYVNKATANIYGYEKKEFVHMHWRSMFKEDTLDWISEEVLPVLLNKGCWSGELIGLKKNGEVFPQYVSFSFIKVTSGIICTFKDITIQKNTEEKIRHMAFHDMLTGLPNRHMCNEYLGAALVLCKQNNQKLAVMFVDLDRFKYINDTMGHDIGDNLLIKVSERLVNSVREEDIVVRQGGDEFIILLENVDESEVKDIANRIIESFNVPFMLKEEEIVTSPSIGISFFPDNGQDIETLTKNADMAMYIAKKQGKNKFSFYTSECEKKELNKINKNVKKEIV
jgi:diguanylate cyclase (GGDEF)-like protein/PAS domain S-box-containing protein